VSHQLQSMTPARGVPTLWGIAPHSIDNLWRYGALNQGSVGPVGAAAWPTQFMIIYVPLPIRQTLIARKLWLAAGATGTGNVDIGIYNRAGTRLVNSGSTAKIAASNEQVFDTTDVRLKPDLYYLALQSDSTTDTFNRNTPIAPNAAAMGVRTQTPGSLGLPSTATWVINQTLLYVPILGILTEVTVT
jgi:hypothetical protein